MTVAPELPVAQRPLAPSRAAYVRPRGGTRWSAALSAGSAGLFVSGLYLWLWPGAGAIVLAHVVGGVAVTLAMVPWLSRHVPRMICHAQRPGFTWASWALLAIWVALVGSGLIMALPAGLWLLGLVWFPGREWVEGLGLVHFWASFAAMAGLILHLAMRHWRLPGGNRVPEVRE